MNTCLWCDEDFEFIAEAGPTAFCECCRQDYGRIAKFLLHEKNNDVNHIAYHTQIHPLKILKMLYSGKLLFGNTDHEDYDHTQRA